MAPPQPMISEYEVQRAQRIQANRRKMEQMGLLEAARGFAGTAATAPQVTVVVGLEQQRRMKKRRVQPAASTEVEPSRLSRRLRGETALNQEAAEAEARAEAQAEGAARARKGVTRKRLALDAGVQLAAPFTLWSIGVTVWELGRVHRGAWAHRYWSSSGCLFHHAYPVGYSATKVQFGHTYEMRIEEGPAGPLFKVTDQQTGSVFSGTSPTKPWTDVCISHRTGQRISGPLFFGFSDPLTQRAIAANLYNEAELRAALQGQKLEQGTASPEEQAAQEFCALDGIGEAMAIVLARSTSLGGSRHAGLASLKAWSSATDKNAEALFDYLTGNEEVPVSTRRWPAWRQRLTPKIVLALSGRWLGSGPPPGAAGAAAAATAAAAGGGKDGYAAAGRVVAMWQNSSGAKQPATVDREPAGGSEETAVQQAAAAVGTVTAGLGEYRPKENKQPQQNRSKPAAGAAAAAAGAQRSSGRERRANSKWGAEFLA